MQSFFFIRSGKRYRKVDISAILYIEAFRNYTRLILRDEGCIILMSLKEIEKLLPSKIFCRIHRSYIVSLTHLTSFDTEKAHVNNYELPIGEQWRDTLLTSIVVLNEIRQHTSKSSETLTTGYR